TLGSGSTSSVAVGDQLLFTQAGPYTGVQTIAAVPSLSTLQFASPGTGTSTGPLLGQTVQVDESLLWMDDVNSAVTAIVPGRWLPLEAPDTDQTETPGPYKAYF